MLKNWIDGQWVNPDQEPPSSLAVFDPARGTELARVAPGSRADVDRAVSAAARAFPAWRALPVGERVQHLFALKRVLEQHLEELAALCTRENGKTLVESRGELKRAIQMVETACGMPALFAAQSGVVEDIASGIDSHAIRQPLGVFAAITPSNFPAMIGFWFLPFAIASGNTFVLKPSERVPLTLTRICELLATLGLPPGVVNLVHGGVDVAQALCEHPDVVGVSFVGSTPAARDVYGRASAHGKRVQSLGGAKNFMVVLPDAFASETSQSLTVRTVVESAIGCAGQRCLAGSVMIGVGDAYERLERGVIDLVRSIRVGPGDEAGVDMGPLTSLKTKRRVEELIDSATKQGARLLVDGRTERARKLGELFLEPSVIGEVTRSMRVAREEIFGPVVCLARADSLTQALEWIRESEFGNTASIFTASGAAARQFALEADAGMLGVNIGVPAPMAYFSFGGRKASFFGDLKAHGRDAIAFYTDNKTVITRWVKDSSIW